MEARIALGSLVVFAGVLTAGMVVTRVNGDEGPSTEFAESELRGVANESPVEFALQRDENAAGMRDEDHWDDDDRYEDDDDEGEWDDDDRYEDDDHDDDDHEEDDD